MIMCVIGFLTKKSQNIKLYKDRGVFDMEIRKGIDVAKWNNITNYSAVKNAGVKFAIPKVININNKADSKFYDHVAGFNSVGIPIIGGYTYSYANTVDKAKKSASAFVNIARPKGIDTMWLDLEDKSIMGLGSTILKIINAYKDIATDAGMDFGIYTGASFYNPCLKKYAKELSNIPFWWARYPSVSDRTIMSDVPDTKYLPKDLELSGWQYSSKGLIPGIIGYTDLNVWYEKEPMENQGLHISAESNPFTEPIFDVKKGAMGNDASWVQWYCWKFGLFLDKDGNPDATEIDGIFGINTETAVKEAQRRLGMKITGIVTKADRAIWKKLA